MAIKDTEIETIMRVHYDGTSLEVGEGPDNPDWIELRNPDKASEEYYGKVSILMPPNMALALGRALVKMATEKGASI